MVIADSELKFVLVYTGFLLFFIVFLSGMFNLNAIEGLTPAQIEQLSTPIEITTNPIVFVQQIGVFFTNMALLLSVSSEIQLLAVVLVPLSIVMAYIIINRVRELLKL